VERIIKEKKKNCKKRLRREGGSKLGSVCLARPRIDFEDRELCCASHRGSF